NALAVADLVLTVYSSNGTTVLLNRNANGVGLAETGSVLLPAAGTYYIKISEANTPTGSQLYKLDLSGSCATTPAFTQQPASLLVNNGQAASFMVAATNATSYQWRKDGVPLVNDGRISGVTTAVLTIAGARSTDAGAYTAVANSTCASTTSQQALLTVLCYAN